MAGIQNFTGVKEMVVAIAGKGGTGKTTVASLFIKHLLSCGNSRILAVDADPNSNLNEALDVRVEETVGDIREEALKDMGGAPGGMTKTEFMEYKLHSALVEASGFDLVAMGRPEGPGCYCFANSILRGCIDRLAQSYHHVIIDCEAGLEHLSRRTTRDVDLLLIVSDPTVRGIATAKRIQELASRLQIRVGEVWLAINRLEDGWLPAELERAMEESGLRLLGTIPSDSLVADYDARGVPLVHLPSDSPAYLAITALCEKVFGLREGLGMRMAN